MQLSNDAQHSYMQTAEVLESEVTAETVLEQGGGHAGWPGTVFDPFRILPTPLQINRREASSYSRMTG